MNEIDKKIEETLGMLDGFQKAQMPDDLATKILQNIENQSVKTNKIIPMRRVWLAAATFSGIVFLNVASMVSSKKGLNTEGVTTANTATIQTFANSYFNNESLNY